MPKRSSGAENITASNKEKPSVPPRVLDRYEIVTIERKEALNAPYNPRVLSEAAYKKLKKGIEKNGIVAPSVWNRRTGNIVGGHQRLRVRDAIEGTRDYSFQVAAIDVDEREEKEINILLNNPQAQGDWDLEKLNEMFAGDTLEIEATGFDVADLYRLFGDTPLNARDSSDAIDELGGQLRKARDRFDELVKKNGASGRDNTDFYLVVVFRDADDCKAFLDDLKLDDNRFQDGNTLKDLLARRGEALEER